MRDGERNEMAGLQHHDDARPVQLSYACAVLFGALPVPYALWSHGRLLGHSELDYPLDSERHPSGEFEPTELGESLMPVVTAANRMAVTLDALVRERRESRAVTARGGPHCRQRRETNARSYIAEADARTRQLALELRGPDGSTIPTESIEVSDTTLVASMVEEDADLFDDCCDSLADEEMELDEVEDIASDDFLAEHELEDLDAAIDDRDRETHRRWAQRIPRYEIHVVLSEGSEAE